MANLRTVLPYWTGFFAVAIASWGAYFWLTRVPAYVDILTVLAATNLLIGGCIVKFQRWQKGTLFIVGIALIIGQFWFLLWCATFLTWRIGGFGP